MHYSAVARSGNEQHDIAWSAAQVNGRANEGSGLGEQAEVARLSNRLTAVSYP